MFAFFQPKNISAAIVYLINKDYAKAFYWVSAASITASTLFM